MTTELVETIAGLRQRLGRGPRPDARVGFVPTMGALHRGHGRLIEHARRDCDRVAVSIFVNPLQFDRADDLAVYPRTLEADLAICESLAADLVFVPSAAEMYPSEPRCTVEVAELGDHLCGKYRPGHFRGVATVVLKLLDIVQPDVAYFGEKDAQQLAIVRRLVADFNLPVEIIGVPTVREEDGLAMSSRNVRLDACERQLAPSLYRAICAACEAVRAGEDVATSKERAIASLPDDPRVRLEYLEIVDPDTMQPVDRIDRPVVVAGAMWVGTTRLIDNARCGPHEIP